MIQLNVRKIGQIYTCLVIKAMQKNKLCEVGNETTIASQNISGIFLPKIIKLGTFYQAAADE